MSQNTENVDGTMMRTFLIKKSLFFVLVQQKQVYTWPSVRIKIAGFKFQTSSADQKMKEFEKHFSLEEKKGKSS